MKLTATQIGKLADAFKRSPETIKRWIKVKDVRLTTDKAKKIIKEK